MIKIGSGLLTDANGLNRNFFKLLVEQVAKLNKKNIEVILVSSGAIASGMSLLKLKTRPADLAQKQAVAAIGQPQLMSVYSQVFLKHHLVPAQILLTKADIENKKRSTNARHAIHELLQLGVIPIINENDSVAVDEIKVGDNDQLSAMVTCLIKADLLIILTDIDGLYTGDPRKDKKAHRLPLVKKVDQTIMKLAHDTHSQKSTGGMITKLKAAKTTLAKKIPTLILKGDQPQIISDFLEGKKETGTLFIP